MLQAQGRGCTSLAFSGGSEGSVGDLGLWMGNCCRARVRETQRKGPCSEWYCRLAYRFSKLNDKRSRIKRFLHLSNPRGPHAHQRGHGCPPEAGLGVGLICGVGGVEGSGVKGVPYKAKNVFEISYFIF